MKDFLDSKMSKLNNFTAGQVYEHVLKEERKGDFLGSTVQGNSSHNR